MAWLSLAGLFLMIHVTKGHTEVETSKVIPGQMTVERQEADSASGKWLPLPIFLTEPAFGYGLGLGLGYFHPKKDDSETAAIPSLQTPKSVPSGRSGQKPPPSITGVAGGYTDKDTWFVAIGHSASWRKDTIRYVGALAYADVKSSYHILDRPLDFGLQGFCHSPGS